MSQAFPDLLEDFNTAATSAAAGKLPMPVLIAHYHTAMRHCDADENEKRSLSAALFDHVHNQLDNYADQKYMHQLKAIDIKSKLAPVLDALCGEESIGFMPRDAARRLAAIVIKSSATGGKVNYNAIGSYDDLYKFQAQIGALAQVALHYAGIIDQPRPLGSVETSKDIVTAKRITLKPAEGGQP